MPHSNNVIFWGAGATAALGIRTTVQQSAFLQIISGSKAPSPELKDRVAASLGSMNNVEPWSSALLDLVTILGDDEGAYGSMSSVSEEQLAAMRRNWIEGTSKEELCSRIIGLRLIYDWPALKSVINLCPGSSTANFRLNDLFNILDMHIPSGFGIRTDVGDASVSPQFLDTRRLIGAKNALLMILSTLFYIDYQACISSRADVLEKYKGFAVALGRRTLRFSANDHREVAFDRPEFYRSDVSFVSLNYDPIALWVQFVANRELNEATTKGARESRLPLVHLFHDFGHLIPARRIGKAPSDWPWYPLNEGGAQRLNEQTDGVFKTKLTKFLFPHGCLCWRECPNCGKLSAYHGDE